MLRSTIARIVDFSARHGWPVIAAALVLAVLSSIYAARHFAIDTDINHLISVHLPWRQHELAYEKAFPQRAELTLVVVQGKTPENVKQATEALAAKLSERRDIIRSVRRPGGGPFFEKNGLLYLSTEEVERTTNQLTSARPLLRTLASDPSLRGMMDGLAYGTSAPNPIRPRLTARSSVSSKPACANGPMPGPTKTLASERSSSRPGSIDTTPISRLGLAENNVLRLHT